MSESLSRLRQQLWRIYRGLARTLRALQRDAPMIQGSLYLLRRRCGKPNCHCAQGELHATWVLTRSEAGRSRLYRFPPEQRAEVRLGAREYRHWQRARARWVKQSAELVALIDQMAEERLRRWPPASKDEPGTD
jgi:hypothetical protein